VSEIRITTTIEEWMTDGPMLVAEGAATVQISDREPFHCVDPITPDGAWGWMYGWRWLSEFPEESRHTLPQKVYLRLPACPFKIVHPGTAPRWATKDEAMSVMNQAAFDWAKDPD
jgi:hypothetical protein